MSSLFCCGSIQPFRPQYLIHQSKFTTFLDWSAFPKTSSLQREVNNLDDIKPECVIQLVRQVNYGPLESTRYFVKVDNREEPFIEIVEKDLVNANFEKLNSYKNYRCDEHNKFFEINIYEKNPINKHHWRVNLARPGSSINIWGWW
ncbi:hypothetical protein JX265_006348 [Neoarthrinium moseri]|uniref:Uncharacterized protein n=1 Tax=Neoarthrinium moseri TaxID=1658444 RepID=A0A9P9WLX3_9PEZI|nr:uncharacterized protein JN550_008262 [Neoarthrinium moseri]KAI1865505.1 hypothetical protein JN550_008262 [Neoarthrinium moseri]KAI1870178.1 hypothetical protein JX265_006348 [Neoarthrinium moseri]